MVPAPKTHRSQLLPKICFRMLKRSVVGADRLLNPFPIPSLTSPLARPDWLPSGVLIPGGWEDRRWRPQSPQKL
jgi:hypothetical protein